MGDVITGKSNHMPAIRTDKDPSSCNPTNTSRTMQCQSSKPMHSITIDVNAGSLSARGEDIYFPLKASERKVFRKKNGKVDLLAN